MKFTGILCVFLVLTMVFTPLLSLKGVKFFENSENSKEVSLEKERKLPDKISVFHVDTGKKENIDLDDYTVLSVCAEIPPDYDEQAIMAQAVACRTYAVYMIENGQYSKADISDDYKLHQGFISKEELKKKWGDKFENYFEKISSCVKQTQNAVITYDGEIIQPAFFALCGGKTENASDIWGGKSEYLKSVISVGDELAENLKSVVKTNKDEFENCLKKLGKTDFEDNIDYDIKITQRTNSGAVKQVAVGSKTFSGSDIQNAFELKSLNFTVEKKDDCFIFTVIGNGHGVGMSQYGANYMAKQGSSFEEILKHYYTGVEVVKFQAEQT